MTKNIDFIIIGAQKAGTTTLFKWLEEHPEIFTPHAKELPLLIDELYVQGFDKTMADFFGEAPKDKLWGHAPPHYLVDPDVPERCKKHHPNSKIIAILRHPIKRACVTLPDVQSKISNQ